MAHELVYDQLRGQMPFASTQKAWHGLGKLVSHAMTAEEAIKEAGLVIGRFRNFRTMYR